MRSGRIPELAPGPTDCPSEHTDSTSFRLGLAKRLLDERVDPITAKAVLHIFDLFEK